MPVDATEDRLRVICLAFPGVTERLSHGAPAFFVTRQFLTIWTQGHHEDTFAHLWCAAPPGAREALVTRSPERFFRPPYVGGRGWVGVHLEGALDWDELEELCDDAYRVIAPARLIAELDARTGGPLRRTVDS